ncbi:MAG: sulfur transferase domain-containing protein [Rubripirellula sp.]
MPKTLHLIIGLSLLLCHTPPSCLNAAEPTPLSIASLPNAFRIDDQVISGGLPDGDEGFAELHRIGVRTIISVDGAKPDDDAARRAGLRYVHLPHGYGGIDSGRVLELAKAITDLPGPVYIHCHHGKHRSPAAAASACIAAGRIDHDAGVEFLTTAGTSRDYQGLHQTVARTKAVAPEFLESMVVDFQPFEAPPALATQMVKLQEIFDSLSLTESSGWKFQSNHTGLNPTQQALMLKECLDQTFRDNSISDRSAEFTQILNQSISNANKLETILRSDPTNSAIASKIFREIKTDCKACHQISRDVP